MNEVVQLNTGGRLRPIVPQSIEEVFRLAKAISLAKVAPKDMSTPEQITVAILHGMEIGLPPMQAVQRIAVIHGRPTLWGDAIPALLLSRGFGIREWMEDSTAFCEVTRPDGAKTTRKFSEVDAKKAGLFGKSGPWAQYPSRMLQMRARGWAARDGAADVLSGLYLREEVEDIDPVDARDITPPIPSIDPPQVASDEPPDPSAAEDEPIHDPAASAGMIVSALAECPPDELDGVLESYDGVIQRLPRNFREQVQAEYERRAT